MSCEFGHSWKVVRKDKLTTDEGTKVLIQFKCKVCGFQVTSDELEDDEKDYEEKVIFGDDLNAGKV